MSVRADTPPAGNEPAPISTGLKRVVAASMAGTVVEWYEFFLYGTAATLVFGKIFFAKATSDDSSLPIALYLAGAAAITLIAVYFTRETKGIDLATIDQADREELAKAGVV